MILITTVLNHFSLMKPKKKKRRRKKLFERQAEILIKIYIIHNSMHHSESYLTQTKTKTKPNKLTQHEKYLSN